MYSQCNTNEGRVNTMDLSGNSMNKTNKSEIWRELCHSAHLRRLDAKQLGKQMDFPGNVADPDSAVVGRAVGVPVVNKAPSTDGKAVATVGVANFEDRPRDRFSLGDEEFERARVFNS